MLIRIHHNSQMHDDNKETCNQLDMHCFKAHRTKSVCVCTGVGTCVFGLIILQSLEPHAEIVNEVSAAYDTALPNILTHTDRERAIGRWGHRKSMRYQKVVQHEHAIVTLI